MKKLVSIVLVILGLFSLISCSKHDIQKESDDFSSYVGIYRAETNDIELTIFDIDLTQGVFFEIKLRDGWSISGNATLDGDIASFLIIDKSAGKNEGTMLLRNNIIKLNILSMQENFENNVGLYSLTKLGSVDVSSTNADSVMGLRNFSLFNEFVSESFDATTNQWAYLGKTQGEFGKISYKDFLITDLYRLTIKNEKRYYAVFDSNIMDGGEFGICEIVGGELTPFLYKKTFGNGANEFLEGEYSESMPYQQERVPLSDSELKNYAWNHFNTVKWKFTNAYHPKSTSMVLVEEISRTDYTITFQTEIRYWLSGGSPTGAVYPSVVLDRFTGDIIYSDVR